MTKYLSWLFIVAVCLGSCGTPTITESNYVVAASMQNEAPPDTKAVVLSYLLPLQKQKEPLPESVPMGNPGTLFKNPEKLGYLAVSKPSSFRHDTLGMVWHACLLSQPIGRKLIRYSLFIVGSAIVDARQSVATDKCGALVYEPLGMFAGPPVRPLR